MQIIRRLELSSQHSTQLAVLQRVVDALVACLFWLVCTETGPSIVRMMHSATRMPSLDATILMSARCLG